MMDELISRQAAIKAIKNALLAWSCMPPWRDGKIVEAIVELPSAQPEDCSTCKYGHFGDRKCDYCRVAYPSHYERDEDE